MSNKYLLIHGLFTDDFYRKVTKRKGLSGVLVLEGRPRLEGAKETCKKLLQNRLTPTLLCDNMAGFCFYREMVKEVHLAAQEIHKTATVCKIGSLVLAVAAKYHKVPVFMHESSRKIESHCKAREIFHFAGVHVAPLGIKAYTALTEEVPLYYFERGK
ncbi:MAG: hypothetical protein ACOY3D_07735 [Candidatus Omnitrophota bacterium]